MLSLVHFVARFRCMLVLGNWLAIWMCFARIWHKWCSFTRIPVNGVEVLRYTSSLVVRQTLCNQSLEAHFATADKWKSPMKSANPASAGTGPKFCLLNAKDHSCHLRNVKKKTVVHSRAHKILGLAAWEIYACSCCKAISVQKRLLLKRRYECWYSRLRSLEIRSQKSKIIAWPSFGMGCHFITLALKAILDFMVQTVSYSSQIRWPKLWCHCEQPCNHVQICFTYWLSETTTDPKI